MMIPFCGTWQTTLCKQEGDLDRRIDQGTQTTTLTFPRNFIPNRERKMSIEKREAKRYSNDLSSLF